MEQKHHLLGKHAVHKVSGYRARIVSVNQNLHKETEVALQSVAKGDLPDNHPDVKWFSLSEMIVEEEKK